MPSLKLRHPGITALLISLATGFAGAAFGAEEPAPAAKSAEPPVPALPSEAPVSAIENSVVKVFSTLRLPDVYRPWTKQAASEVTGSGVVIDGKRILTNAHVVTYASQTQVQANQAGDKVSATVEAIAPSIDLAVLKLEDETFPHKLVNGYGSAFSQVVKSINGVAVRNLDHLVEILRDSKDEFITIEFGGHSLETLVLPRAETAAATEDILTDNGVRSQGSADTMAIWKGPSAR